MSTAIVGLNGLLGSAFLETFLDPQFNVQPVIAVSRDISKYNSTDKVKYYEFSDLDKVVQEADVLISLSKPTPELYQHFYDVLSKPNKVKLYFPSSFIWEDEPVQTQFPGLLDGRARHVNEVRKLGIKTVNVFTSFFAIPGGYLYEYYLDGVGLDVIASHVTYVDRGDVAFAVTSPRDVARSIATLITEIPIGDIPGDLKIYSDLVTPRDVVNHYVATHPGATITESSIPYHEAYQRVKEIAKNFTIKDFPFVAQFIAAGGPGKGSNFSTSHRELVNPNQSKWLWFDYLAEK